MFVLSDNWIWIGNSEFFLLRWEYLLFKGSLFCSSIFLFWTFKKISKKNSFYIEQYTQYKTLDFLVLSRGIE